MSAHSEIEHQLRRLVPRQFADWRGKYMIEGDPGQRWRDCRVIDISSAGAGLELIDTTVAEVEGRRILMGLQLKGEVKHSREEGANRILVGTQFVELTSAEQAYLASLEQLDARW